jgi:quercetin dioxygenase-like cupin family protein
MNADRPVDLACLTGGSGPLWGMQSDELNATLLVWPPGGGVAEHTNDQLEVVMVVLEGSARVRLDGSEHQLEANQLLVISRGRARAITAGPAGVRYLSVHRRRGPLLPSSRVPPTAR